MKMICLHHAEGEEIRETYINIAHVVAVWHSPHLECSVVRLSDGSLEHCTETVDTILTRLKRVI